MIIVQHVLKKYGAGVWSAFVCNTYMSAAESVNIVLINVGNYPDFLNNS
jgi:hypothetical protein